MSCRVKICGITNLEDARLAVLADADALGFVFYSNSPRYITPDAANEIVAKLPPFVTPVALFVDADPEEVLKVMMGSRRWVFQFHGNESRHDCERYGVPYYKALRMKPDLNVQDEVASYHSASAILLDAYKPGVPGGTGETFDWQAIPDNLDIPIILAGGLTVGNVAQAVTSVRPYAVDVSGGVEYQKGKKAPTKMNDFVRLAKSV